jgi:putative SOS response-associated peptidase YedK
VASLPPTHARDPPILWIDLLKDYLGKKAGDWLADLLLPFPAEAMAVYPVGSLVNSVTNDSP